MPSLGIESRLFIGQPKQAGMRVRHDQFVSSDLREPLHPQRVIVSGKRGLLEETSELLVPTSCPVPIWWKTLRATVDLTADPNPAIRRTIPPGSQLWKILPLTTSQFRVPLLLQRGHSRVRVSMKINAVVEFQPITLGACILLRPG